MKYLVRKAKAIITALIDARSEFADAASLVANAAATAIFGNVIPLDKTGMNLGNSMTPIFLVISIDTAVAAAGGAANITFKLLSDVVATLDGAGVTTLLTTPAIAKGTLVAGYNIVIPLPLSNTDYQTFLGVTWTPDTNNITAGKANAYLTVDPPNGWKAYANAI